MSRFLLLCAGLAAFSAPVWAQSATRVSATAPRVLADGISSVKDEAGRESDVRITVTYDPTTGTTTRTWADPVTGVVLTTEPVEDTMIRPSADEESTAQALIAADPELSAIIAASPREVVVSGGFALVRGDGDRCDATARCVMYDIFELVPGQRQANRLRYVAIDLRRLEIVDRDLNPVTEANFANPAIRAESRSR